MIAYGKKWSIIILKGIKKRNCCKFIQHKKKLHILKTQNRNDGFSVWSSKLN